MSSPTGETPLTQTETAPLTFRGRRGWQILFLALFGVLCGFSLFLDVTVIQLIAAHSSKSVRNIGGFISDYGDWPWLMLYAIPFLVWGWWKKRRRLYRFVLMAMVSSSLAGIAVNAIKATTGRSRPNHTAVVPGWYGFRHEDKWIIGKNKFASFPSGHTATAFGFFSVLAFQRGRWSILWFVPAGLIGISRMVVNAHHLSDVCFGVWLALLTTWWCIYRLEHFAWFKKLLPPAN